MTDEWTPPAYGTGAPGAPGEAEQATAARGRRRLLVPLAVVATVAVLAVLAVVLTRSGGGDGDGPAVHHAELVAEAGDGTRIVVALDIYRGRRTSERVCGRPPDRSLVIPVRLSVENRSSHTAEGSAGIGVLIQRVSMTSSPGCLGVESSRFGQIPAGDQRSRRYLLVVENYFSPAAPDGDPAASEATVYVSAPPGYRAVGSTGGDEARTVLGSASFEVPLSAAMP